MSQPDLKLPEYVELLGLTAGGYHLKCLKCGQQFVQRDKNRLECPHRLIIPPHPPVEVK